MLAIGHSFALPISPATWRALAVFRGRKCCLTGGKNVRFFAYVLSGDSVKKKADILWQMNDE